MKKLFLALVASVCLLSCAPVAKVVFKEAVGFLGGKAGQAVGEAAGRVAGAAMKASDLSEAPGAFGGGLGSLIGELSGELAWNYAGSLASSLSPPVSAPGAVTPANGASFSLDRVLEEDRSVTMARDLKVLEYYQLFDKGDEVRAGGDAREYRIEYAFRVTDLRNKRGFLESLRFSARSEDGVLSPLYTCADLEFSYGDEFRLAGGLAGLPADLTAVLSLLLDCEGEEDELFANTTNRLWLPGERGVIDRTRLASTVDFASLGVDPGKIFG
ncbi:MAG: hypothetical protein JNG85_12950, partial [Spirochaetaceae bacterium]|nr:hypothetical protein [Spirochaetaceae bacterium]